MTNPTRREDASIQAVDILVADDGPEDRFLVKKAFEASDRLRDVNLEFVKDGVELLAYLRREGSYEHLAGHPLPALVLLDLDMPRKTGSEALEEIRQCADLRGLPVVILSTSTAELDLARTEQLGANAYVTKPDSFEGLVQFAERVTHYWRELAKQRFEGTGARGWKRSVLHRGGVGKGFSNRFTG